MTRKFYFLILCVFVIIATQNLIAKDSEKGVYSKPDLTVIQAANGDSSYFFNNNLLKQNYPNPFNPTTTIEFSLPERSYVELNIYNVLGVKITTLVQGVEEAGTYSIQFNASKYPSGLYIYELQTDRFKQTKKMIYMK